MGGYVAFALSRRAPERFTGMVLADTKSAADTPEARQGRRAMIELGRKRRSSRCRGPDAPEPAGPDDP